MAAILLYFAIVFGVGFLLGPVRILVLEPLVGPTLAVACEAPILVAVMIASSRWLPARLGMPPKIPALAAMGVGALVLQQTADLAVGIFLRAMTPSQILANFATPAGAIYALTLAAFAAMPLVVNWHRLVRTS